MLIINTDTIIEEKRKDITTHLGFSKCENCGYINCEITGAKNGKYVRFYRKHLLALCDECVDKKNGHSWN